MEPDRLELRFRVTNTARAGCHSLSSVAIHTFSPLVGGFQRLAVTGLPEPLFKTFIMKAIYSLSEFANAVKEIADLIKEDYYTVSTEFKRFSGHEFKCYIHGKGQFTGTTPDECLAKLRESLSAATIKIIDVEIEVPEKEEAPA